MTDLAFPYVGDMDTAQNISTGTIPGELPRSLGVAHTKTSNITQIFYLDGVEMRQMQYSNDQWSVGGSGGSCPNSGIANGPLGAVGFGAEGARLLYLIEQGTGDNNSTILQAASDVLDTGWNVGTLVNDDYG